MNDSVKSILDGSILGVLATTNEDGSAWSTPLHLFYDEAGLYWFSQETTQHAKNCQNNARVSVSIFSPDESEGVKGVYVSGAVEKIAVSTLKYEQAQALVLARLGAIRAVFSGATAYFIPFGAINTTKSNKNCWYFYS